MYVVTVNFVVSPEYVDQFREAMLVQARNSLLLEQECRVFDVCVDADDPQRIFLYEKYDSPDAFEAHLASDHFRSFDALVAPWVSQKSVMTFELVEQSQ